MENKDQIKVLETKLKLALDIIREQKSLIHNLNRLGSDCIHILTWCKESESTEDNNILKLNKENMQVLEDLIYTAKSKELTSQRTASYLKEAVKEIKIKQEILNGL